MNAEGCVCSVQERPWPALGASSFTSIYDGDVIMIDNDTRWDWSVTVELCSQPWMPCALKVRGDRKCKDYVSEHNSSADSCRGVAGCEWAGDDSCAHANDGYCTDLDDWIFPCDLGTDSTDCGTTSGGTCTGKPLSTSGNGTISTVRTLLRSASGVIACHASSGCTGMTFSDLSLQCSPDVLAPAGPFQVSGDVEMTIEHSRFSDCRSVQHGGTMCAYNGATVSMVASTVQRSSSQGSGGGAAVVGAHATFTKSSFLECSAAQAGGAVWGSEFVQFPSDSLKSTVQVVACEFANNSAVSGAAVALTS